MSAPCSRAFRAAFLFAFLFAPAAVANTLPPAPVMGHPADYVIVTPAAFAPEFQVFAKWKTKIGLPAYVKTMESIVAEYPGGRDDAERVRMFLQDAHAQWGTHWVLLGGVPPYVPVRIVHTTFYGGLDFASDLYFGALAGTWDADGDGIFGEGFIDTSNPGDGVDLHSDVFVGRAPVRSASEAHDFVGKTLRAGFEPFPPTPNTALFAADVLFPRPWHPGDPITLDGADITEAALDHMGTTLGTIFVRLYQNTAASPASSPLTGPALLAALRAGTDFFLLVDNGFPSLVAAGPDSLHPDDFAALTDAPRPTSAYLLSQSTGDFTGPSVPLAFVRGATGGAATCIAPSTFVFPTAQQYYVTEYAGQAYGPNFHPVGQANALSKLPFIPYSQYDGVHRLTQMEMNLVGDPATRIRPGASEPLAADVPDVVVSGAPGFDIVVTSGAGAVEGAAVTAVLGDADLALAVTDAAGRAHLELAAGGSGPAEVTVAAPDGGWLEQGVTVQAGVLGVADGATRVRFDRPEPNPARASARFAGAVTGPASLDLFDVGGRRVRTFALESGAFDFRWDLRDASGRRIAPGLYLARLGTAGGARVQRLLVGR